MFSEHFTFIQKWDVLVAKLIFKTKYLKFFFFFYILAIKQNKHKQY